MPDELKVYDKVIIYVFEKVRSSATNIDELPFTKSDIEEAIKVLGLELTTRNIPDIAYTYRSGRSSLPEAVLRYGNWAIEGKGKSKYVFRKLIRSPYFDIPSDIAITTVPDATPQVVLKYQGNDEQAFLARIRYNRLVDMFTLLTVYHLQSHFRTTVTGTGQIEIDDLYMGLDVDGTGYILPVEAKASPKEALGVVQITQMVRLTRQQYPDLLIRPIAVKLLPDNSYLFLEFTNDVDANQIATQRYKRYKLV